MKIVLQLNFLDPALRLKILERHFGEWGSHPSSGIRSPNFFVQKSKSCCVRSVSYSERLWHLSLLLYPSLTHIGSFQRVCLVADLCQGCMKQPREQGTKAAPLADPPRQEGNLGTLFSIFADVWFWSSCCNPGAPFFETVLLLIPLV